MCVFLIAHLMGMQLNQNEQVSWFAAEPSIKKTPTRILHSDIGFQDANARKKRTRAPGQLMYLPLFC
jgi:hypothetical protein